MTRNGSIFWTDLILVRSIFRKIFKEFSNSHFKDLYYTIIDTLNQNPDYAIDSFINTVDASIANEITNILMEDERYTLANWESKNIFPKDKHQSVAQLVSETILSLRCFLIEQKVSEFQQETKANNRSDNRTVLEEVKDYSSLKMLLSRKLNRVL